MRGNHHGLMRALDAAEIEIKLVEGQALDELAMRFRLERGQRRIAEFLVSVPISFRDRAQQPVGQLQQFVDRGVGHYRSPRNSPSTSARDGKDDCAPSRV